MSDPNPKLLSLLDQIANPIESVKVSLTVEGVFAIPDEWKTTDDANPNMFTYQVKMLGMEVTDGKIYPRQLTEKEIKEQEELANAKNKKATKKDAKQEVQISAEEEEEQRKHKLREEEEERIRQEEWNKLDEQTQFYRTQEDKYKTISLKFDMKIPAENQNESNNANTNSVQKEGVDLVVLEERISDNKGDWLYFVKMPNLTEDEIAKLKKSKPKNLNITDLNPVVMRAWVDFTEFQNPGVSRITQRCKIEQYFEDPSATADISKPKLDHTYILITLRTDPPLNPLILEIQPLVKDLIPIPPPIPKLSSAKECVKEFKQDLQLAMESLAIEYSQMFAKELGQNNDSKQKTIITVQKKQEIQKRKEHFLYDFNMTGKYKVLKERLKKSIVKICRDKFQKQGSITGITTDQKDQFYSELYVFLMEQTRSTLQDLIEQKKEELHEDIVTSYDQTKKEREKILQNITKETDEERILRLAQEYDILNYKEMAEKNYKNLLNLDDRNPRSYVKYAKYLLQQKEFTKAEQSLEKALSFELTNTDYQLLMACLLMKRSRAREASVFLKELTQNDPTNLLYNSIYQFLYANYLKQDKLAEKYKRICERIYQRKNNLIPSQQQHKENPSPYEIPIFKPKQQDLGELNKFPKIDNNQWDEINMEMIDYFAKNNLFDLVEKALGLINDQTTYRSQIIMCKLEQFKENYTKCLKLLNDLDERISQDKSKKKEAEEIITIKCNVCFLSGQLFQGEQIFCKALKLKGSKKQDLSIYLRLGNMYLTRQSWGDAKAIFLKACEFKSNSSLSWLGLGISCLRIGEFKEAEEALTQSNIYDPFNGDTWSYLALLCLKDNGRFNQANQCLRELFKTDINDYGVLEEIGDALVDLGQNETAQTIYMKIIDFYVQQKKTPDNYGQLNLKLGKVYNNLKKYKESAVCFDEALQNLEGDNEKNQARILRDHVANFLDNSFDQD